MPGLKRALPTDTRGTAVRVLVTVTYEWGKGLGAQRFVVGLELYDDEEEEMRFLNLFLGFRSRHLCRPRPSPPPRPSVPPASGAERVDSKPSK